MASPAPVMPPGYDELLAQFRATQNALQQLVSSHAQLESQLNENGMVKEELDRLGEDNPVFKLCGKVLVRQDTADAKSTVESRISFIQAELTKARKAIDDSQTKAAGLRAKLVELQQAAAAAATAGGAAASGGAAAK